MRISLPGTSDGYVLVDALMALFVGAILCGAVLAGTGVSLKISARQRDRVRAEIGRRSALVETELRSNRF